MDYSIRVYKQYFNFASSHFLIFQNGEREPLHGHNYRVQIKGDAPKLTGDMVFDFLDIKPIVRKVCDQLDHKLLLPENNPRLEVFAEGPNYQVSTPDGSRFSFPQTDVLLLPIANTSAELLASYLARRIEEEVFKEYKFQFTSLEVEVEETPGQSAVYIHKSESKQS